MESCSLRALEIEMSRSVKEDTMVPGITDTECRIAEIRYRELHVEAERQRRSAPALLGDASRERVMETVQRHIIVLSAHARHLLQTVRPGEGLDVNSAPGPLAISQ
jgi:hypothetical protein